jgi:hypothetical protein
MQAKLAMEEEPLLLRVLRLEASLPPVEALGVGVAQLKDVAGAIEQTPLRVGPAGIRIKTSDAVCKATKRMMTMEMRMKRKRTTNRVYDLPSRAVPARTLTLNCGNGKIEVRFQIC